MVSEFITGVVLITTITVLLHIKPYKEMYDNYPVLRKIEGDNEEGDRKHREAGGGS